MNIRLFKPSLGNDELAGIKETFDKSWVGLGEKVIEFENEWSKFIGCKASIGLNSATAALHIAVQTFGFAHGKKIMVPQLLLLLLLLPLFITGLSLFLLI